MKDHKSRSSPESYFHQSIPSLGANGSAKASLNHSYVIKSTGKRGSCEFNNNNSGVGHACQPAEQFSLSVSISVDICPRSVDR